MNAILQFSPQRDIMPFGVIVSLIFYKDFTMSTEFLTEYLQQHLTEASFPIDKLDLEYSLSYCQGDGVAFYGNLNANDCLTLYKTIYGIPKTAKEKRHCVMFEKLMSSFLNYDINGDVINIWGNQFSHRYSHYNTMDIFEDNDLDAFWNGVYLGVGLEHPDHTYFDQNYYSSCYEFHLNKRKHYQSLWNEFIKDLQEYVVTTSHNLEKIGYKFLEDEYCDTDEYCDELVS